MMMITSLHKQPHQHSPPLTLLIPDDIHYDKGTPQLGKMTMYYPDGSGTSLLCEGGNVMKEVIGTLTLSTLHL